jgi:hypothetical protein
MLTQKTTLALLLATFTVAAVGCGSSPTPAKKDGGAGSGGTAGSTGTAGAGTAGASTGVAGQGGGGTAGAVAGSDGGVDAPITQDAPPEVPPYMPDGGQGHSWLFNTSTTGIDGWHFTIYGSTPSATAANNLAILSGTPVWDGTNDADNLTTSGSLKGTVPFTKEGDRIDFQAFSVAAGLYDWRGYKISAKIKLVSGGNINAGCPLHASLYVSSAAPAYTTPTSTPVDLVKGSWVTVTFDLADSGIDLTTVSQMGVQINTGTGCAATVDAGALDGGTDGPVADAAAADGGADGGAIDAGDGPPPAPPTATTAVILIDDVIVSVK